MDKYGSDPAAYQAGRLLMAGRSPLRGSTGPCATAALGNTIAAGHRANALPRGHTQTEADVGR
jgi:hypothetical protein